MGNIGKTMTKYVIPGLETAGGAASEFFAPGNPIGLGLMGSGIGQLAGGGAGGDSGQALGGSLGGLLGMGGGMLGGSSLAGMFGGGGATSGMTASGAPFQTAGMTADVPPAASGGGGLMDLMKSPIANTLLNQVGNFGSSKANQQQPPAPQLVSSRPGTANPVTPIGPPASATPDASPLANYASLIRRFSPAMAA